MHAFSGRFSRASLEGISFNFFVCFIFNVSLGSAPKRKNFDIQRNTRVGSGGQFTSNRLSNDHMHSLFFMNKELLSQKPKIRTSKSAMRASVIVCALLARTCSSSVVAPIVKIAPNLEAMIIDQTCVRYKLKHFSQICLTLSQALKSDKQQTMT